MDEEPARGEPRSANLCPRICAWILDWMVITFLTNEMIIPLLHISGIPNERSGPLSYIGLSTWIGAIYFVGCICHANGQTVGKAVMYIRVTKFNGSQLTYAEALARYALTLFVTAHWLLIFCVCGCLCDCPRTSRQRGKFQYLVHDRLLDTIVIFA